MFLKKSFRMTSRRVSARLYETVDSMKSALHSVQRCGSKLHGGPAEVSVVKKAKCKEGGRRYSV